MRAEQPLRVLVVEDQEDDSVLLLRELARGGYRVHWVRVDTEPAMAAALTAEPWDIVISDYSMPSFDALGALALVKARGLDLPFIIVSGTIGEDTAVVAMKAGAHDFIVKGQFKRLLPAIARELREARERAERRRAEEALRRSEERFRTLIASMDDVVFTMDRDLRFDEIYAHHPPVRELSRDYLLGHSPREAFGSEGATHETAARSALAGERVVYEWQVAAGNETRCFQTALSSILDADGQPTGLVGVSRDITEQKRVHEQLLISDRMASVGTLAAGVAHEINNPLAVVLTNLDYVHRLLPELEHDGHGALPPTLLEALGDARESADRAGHLVQDLKVFSRSPDEEQRHPVDVKQVLDSSARMARNEVRHRARLIMKYDEVPAVLGSEARLGQVFLNLIVNAAQSIPEGHAHEHEVRLMTHMHESGMVAVEVSDTGRGMEPAVLRKLFTPFFTTKPIGEGTGLGLSICHRIVSSFGGRMEVESQLGQGTLFRVLLPPALRLTSTVAPARAARLRAAGKRRGRVLIVDDEPMIASALARELSDDHDVVVAGQGQGALERIGAGERFDAILCDVMMPVMTGRELYDALCGIAPDQAERIIFVTGGAFTDSMLRFLDNVRNPRLDKPFDMPLLRRLIDERVENGDPPRRRARLARGTKAERRAR